MSKQTARKSRRHADHLAPARRQTGDGSIYLGLVVIGAGIVLVAWLLTHGAWWRPVALAYLAAMAALVNLYAYHAYRGRAMANWKQALARIPLRFAGYGTRHGKPLHAAHNSDRARKAIIISGLLSLIILAALVLAFYPEIIAR